MAKLVWNLRVASVMHAVFQLVALAGNNGVGTTLLALVALWSITQANAEEQAPQVV